MKSEDYSRRLQKIILIRREISLAILAAEDAQGSLLWGHYIWHAFKPFMDRLSGGDVLVWADQLQDILIPAMLQHGDPHWTTLAGKIVPIVNSLRQMEPGPLYGCPRCT
jgi:hypothetical protein